MGIIALDKAQGAGYFVALHTVVEGTNAVLALVRPSAHWLNSRLAN